MGGGRTSDRGVPPSEKGELFMRSARAELASLTRKAQSTKRKAAERLRRDSIVTKRHQRFVLCALCFALCALCFHGAAVAQATYQIQPIAKLGDPIAGMPTPAVNGYFQVGAMNENGDLVFVASNTTGGEALIQYANGQLTAIAVPGTTGPSGTWPANMQILPPVGMNQLGDIVFVAGGGEGDAVQFSTYGWDARTQKITPILLRGMPALPNVAFEQGGGPVPTINNLNEVALVGKVKDAAGQTREGVWLLGRDHRLVPIAVPGQKLPDGRVIEEAASTSVNNAGTVAFLARRQGDPPNAWSAYFWEQGTITPVAVIGAPSGGGAIIGTVWAISLNDRNRRVTIEASVGAPDGLIGIYRFADGKLTPLVVPGQSMPGGGTLKIQHGTGYPNMAGEYAFWATLDDGSTAAYLLNENSSLSLIVKSGTATPFGRITSVAQGNGLSHGIALNTQGQVAVTLRIEDVVDALVLLNPVAQ
jgi:hypothetical protein